jgi:hypothetical protein
VSWFWLNVPLMSVFFLAVAGIPLWMTLRHPETAKLRASRSTRLDATPQSVPVLVIETPAAERELTRA